jgi:hypothetical protein
MEIKKNVAYNNVNTNIRQINNGNVGDNNGNTDNNIKDLFRTSNSFTKYKCFGF